jgi:hypothetical protein
MIALDSDRSSADSTAATTVGESCSPQGVRSPNELLNHFEVDHAGLLHEPAFAVVDPVARERARPDELVARAAVGVDRQSEGRPSDRWPELDEWLVRHGPRRWQAHPTTDGLDEPCRRRTDLRLGLDVGQVDRGETQGRRPDPDGRRADVALAQVAGVRDPSIFDLDECAELVRLTEAIARPELLEILKPIRRRLVVVGNADLEWDFRRAGDRLRRDPGHRGDGGLEALDGHGRSPRERVAGWGPGW